uniref:Uncharacterized protein n=1 Tax=Arundo donax TaxID=35708 RepID=A0A0A9GSQ8_ARUDO
MIQHKTLNLPTTPDPWISGARTGPYLCPFSLYGCSRMDTLMKCVTPLT